MIKGIILEINGRDEQITIDSALNLLKELKNLFEPKGITLVRDGNRIINAKDNSRGALSLKDAVSSGSQKSIKVAEESNFPRIKM